MLTIAAGAYLCGRLLDSGVSARVVATGTGAGHADSCRVMGAVTAGEKGAAGSGDADESLSSYRRRRNRDVFKLGVVQSSPP